MDTMLSKALREFTTGPLNQLIVNIGGQEGGLWEGELKKFLRRQPCWSKAEEVKPQPKQKLLGNHNAAFAASGEEEFVAKKLFVCDGHPHFVKISSLNENFKDWFLHGEGKVETTSKGFLRGAVLRKSARDIQIITEIGGEEMAETRLFEMYSLMLENQKTNSGPMLGEDCGNIFYIRDRYQKLRVIYATWYRGWRIEAASIGKFEKWGGTGRLKVFFRSSPLRYPIPLEGGE